MFFPNSRYVAAGTVEVVGPNGQLVRCTRIPVRAMPAALGEHRRQEGQRLDLLAAHYLADPTAFWQLCDASDAIAPDALAIAESVRVPRKGG
jgi:hypothetical protein